MLKALAFLSLLTGPFREAAPSPCTLPQQLPAASSSLSCMSCHDGSIAPLADAELPSADPDHGQSHPVEVSYDDAVMRHPRDYTPTAALPPALVLNSGRVTCVTCHHPDSTERFRVSLPMEGSRLCRACHAAY